MENADPIKHVIVLVLENRSFDHMLGGLTEYIPCDGAPAEPRCNNGDDPGESYCQEPGASRVIRFDPQHDVAHVREQLKDDNGGFVKDFARTYPDSNEDDRAEIMKYHTTLPALHTLAMSFTVCDKWFSSVPGPTWANRFFIHSGTSLGRVAMPNGILDANLHWYDQTTLYDRLNERQKRWKIYYGDIPQSLILVHQLEPRNAINYRKMPEFFVDAAGPESHFPDYCFIEPAYYQPGANDDHPTHDIMGGDHLIADVYNAVRQNQDLWNTSLLVILFDEHGGFYDHVPPPATIAPDEHTEEFDFTRMGVRVPAVLVSPYLPQKCLSTQFDHTSLLRYLRDKWNLGPLGARTATANSFAGEIGSTPRIDTPRVIPIPDKHAPPAPAQPLIGRPELNGHQVALFSITQLLESMTDVAGEDLKSRAQRIVTGFDGVVDVGIERVEAFLSQARAAPETEVRVQQVVSSPASGE